MLIVFELNDCKTTFPRTLKIFVSKSELTKTGLLSNEILLTGLGFNNIVVSLLLFLSNCIFDPNTNES